LQRRPGGVAARLPQVAVLGLKQAVGDVGEGLGVVLLQEVPDLLVCEIGLVDRVEVVQGDAREVESLVADTPFSTPDAIVCSVPLNTSWAGELVKTISRVLPPDGLYLQVSFTSSPVEAHFNILRSHRILLNIPPERVHVAVHGKRKE